MNKTVLSVALTVFVLLVVIRIFNISYPIDLKIVNTNVSSELSVVGDGKVDVKPDTAVIDAGITVSRARTAAEAKERMTRVNNAIIAGVKGLGIKEADITTSNFSINPEFDYSNNPVMPMTEPAVDLPASAGSSGSTSTTNVGMPEKLVPPDQGNSRIVGYNGNANVTIKIRNIDQAAAVIEKVTAAGANNVGSPRFTVEDPDKYREEARNKAIANAREQAQKLSKELGIKLGKITNIVEGGSAYPVPMYDRAYGAAMNAEAKSAPPTIEEGTQTVTSSVTLYFERK